MSEFARLRFTHHGRHRAIVRCVAFLTLLCCAGRCGQVAAQPNIVVVVSDDAGYNDFGFTSDLNSGNTTFQTPNLDALAASSVVMSSGYVAAPLCSPSRAGFLTGQQPSRFGYEDNISDNNTGPDYGLESDQLLISHYLKDLGYTTGAIGKWHLGSSAGANQPLDMGFDEFYGFLGGNRSYWETSSGNITKQMRRNSTNIESQWAHEGNASRYDPVKGRYLTDAFGEEAADFIDRHAGDDAPFFLYVALTAPHTPLDAKQEDLDRFADITDLDRQRVAAMTYGMDRAVGEITDALSSNGLDDDTIVVFFNDNGGPSPAVAPHSNFPYRNYKGSLWEGGFRVPFMIRTPGLETGVYDRPVQSLDLLPTLVNAAGGDADLIDTNGTDLMPYLTGEATGDPSEQMFWRSAGGRFTVRRGDWKLVRPDSTYIRLFNITNDRSETSDLSSQNPALVGELLRELTFWEATLEKPKWGGLGAARNRFDHFVFRSDVALVANWSTSSSWAQAGTSDSVIFRTDDAYANAILEFGVRNDADYTATNDMLRTTGQTFMLNQLRFTGDFSGVSNRSAAINGNALLLVKSLDGQLPQIRLDATSSSPTANFAFQIENTLQLLDDLEIVGEGTQQFVINGNIRDYFEPRSVIKKGASSVTLGGVNTFGGTLTVNGGELTLSGSGASITGASAIFINGTAKLILEDGTISTGALTTAAADSFEFLGGRLAVTSIVGSLENNGGTFAPGASPAVTTISGGFLQNSGELEIELGGPTAGTQYDRLVINGSAELGGTLTILLINGYVPALGSAFEFLTAAGGVSGIFDDLLLPILGDGKAWTTRYEGTGVMLLVTVQGDYNGNGVVDAADYTTWRDSLGQSGTGLAADGNGDEMITMLDYNVWKSNFGQTALGGDSFTTRNVLGESPASGVAAVPEPTAFLMAVVAGLLIIMPSRRRRAAT